MSCPEIVIQDYFIAKGSNFKLLHFYLKKTLDFSRVFF